MEVKANFQDPPSSEPPNQSSVLQEFSLLLFNLGILCLAAGDS